MINAYQEAASQDSAQEEMGMAGLNYLSEECVSPAGSMPWEDTRGLRSGTHCVLAKS